MAERKPLFMDQTEGFSTEMATTDTATFGGLTLGGDIAMGGNKVTGLADGVAATDAVTRSQLDTAVITGGTVKEIVLYNGQLDDTQGILAAMATYFQNQPVSGDNIVISDGTTTRTYQFGAGGDVTVTIGATAADTMDNFAAAVTGDGSGVWDAVSTPELDDINPAKVVVVYERTTAVGSSTSRMYGVWTTQSDAIVVEYASGGVVDTDYQSSAGVTLPSTDPTEGRFGLRKQQAALLDGEIHFVRENDSLYSWDDADNVWQVLSGSAAIPDATSAPGGGVKGKVTFDENKGLLVTSGIAEVRLSATGGLEFQSGQIGVDLEATNPTLQVTGNELGVKLDPARAITTGASGIGVNVDNSTITIVGNQLVAEFVDEAQRIENDLAVNEAVVIGNAVNWSTTNDRIEVSDSDGVNREAYVIGVATTAQPTIGQTATIVSHGLAAGVIGAATAGTPYYLQNDGTISSTVPGAGNRIIQVGVAANATDLWVRIIDYGKKAA